VHSYLLRGISSLYIFDSCVVKTVSAHFMTILGRILRPVLRSHTGALIWPLLVLSSAPSRFDPLPSPSIHYSLRSRFTNPTDFSSSFTIVGDPCCGGVRSLAMDATWAPVCGHSTIRVLGGRSVGSVSARECGFHASRVRESAT